MKRRPALLAMALMALSGLSIAVDAPIPATPAEHMRTPDQTFLTFPEWYLVHSPAEYAASLTRGDAPSRFPLFAHIGQFWQSYAAVTQQAARFPFNAGYHLMIMVIGTSTTVEYSLKGMYEHTVGRLAEATRSDEPIPEERFAARFAQDYVDFIRVDPWYKFDFWSRFQSLWATVPTSGPNLLRRWERRYTLTNELLIKEGYARLIKLGTQTIYDAPKPVTAVVLSHAPSPDVQGHPDYLELQPSAPGSPVLATIPRYEGFTHYGEWLAGQGIDFETVAGNRGDILVSLLVPNDWAPPAARWHIEQPILTQPGRKRVVLALPVAELGGELRRALASSGQVMVEHVYDF